MDHRRNQERCLIEETTFGFLFALRKASNFSERVPENHDPQREQGSNRCG
jgi:hypothetical protein